MHLSATFHASAFDEYYEMALIYCIDKKRNYCFSLTRFPDEDEIGVMVLDQINCKVEDLTVKLTGNIMAVQLENDIAEKLDGHSEYTIALDGDEGSFVALISALRKIFEGKNGLVIAA